MSLRKGTGITLSSKYFGLGLEHGTSTCGEAQVYTINGKQSCCCECSAKLCFHATVTDKYDFCSSTVLDAPLVYVQRCYEVRSLPMI